MMNRTSSSSLDFIGLDTRYHCADGTTAQRIHLDGAASPLACKTAITAIDQLLPHYSNTHSYVHSSAKISTKALDWAHKQILEFVGASPETFTTIFSGAGTTAAINRLARGLKVSRPERSIVLVSSMEHHANDLPHRQFNNDVRYIELTGSGNQLGTIDLDLFEGQLKANEGQVNYVAVSSVSNVTGIKNPIREMAQLAKKYDAKIIVDGAQSVAHLPTDLDETEIDFFIFSGHKVYTPMSPGVLVAKKSSLEELGEQDLGGGSVSTVSYHDYQLAENYPEREQSGTPNIVGAIALGSVVKALAEFGFPAIQENEIKVMNTLLRELNKNPNITVYGDHALARTGAIAFNHKDIDHGLLAAMLNDYFAIAVRNECFCAHPYVSSLLKEELWELDLSDIAEDQHENYINRKRGMVRASVSAYTTEADVLSLVQSIQKIEQKFDEWGSQYTALPSGAYVHQSFSLDWENVLSFIE